MEISGPRACSSTYPSWWYHIVRCRTALSRLRDKCGQGGCLIGRVCEDSVARRARGMVGL